MLNRKNLSILVILLSVGIGVSAFLMILTSFEDTAEIYIEGDTLFYHGEINESRYEKLKSITDENPNINMLEIASTGEDTKSGKDIGKIVFDRKLDVVVDAICFSSCANYIFPSGVEKFIKENSFVGWHGSEFQYDVLSEIYGESPKALLKNAIAESCNKDWSCSISDEYVQNEYELIISGLEDEEGFFDMIGIDKNVTLNGLYTLTDSECIVWTHSISNMAMYGIDNVSYLSDMPYSDEATLEEYGICLI